MLQVLGSNISDVSVNNIIACFFLFVSFCSLMFWTNWNEQSPSIMRATLAGANVLIIIGSDIRTPNGLAIDHRAEKLYFSDATLDKIERCEYDGTQRHVSELQFEIPFFNNVHFPLFFGKCTFNLRFNTKTVICF